MKTRDRILAAAEGILVTSGAPALSFDTIARALGVSKQAVLYWFPTKTDLLAELFVPWVRDEAEVAVTALSDAAAPPEAIAAFVRAVTGFHLGRLDRFRLMYVVPQTLKAAGDPADRAILPRIHAASDRLYAALALALPGPPAEARQQAMAVHSACLGLVLMVGLAESAGDPLKHRTEDLITALIARLGGAEGGVHG